MSIRSHFRGTVVDPILKGLTVLSLINSTGLLSQVAPEQRIILVKTHLTPTRHKENVFTPARAPQQALAVFLGNTF